MSRSRRTLPVGRRHAALGLAVCGLLAACTMGPDYRPPEVQVPGKWQPPPPVAGGDGNAGTGLAAGGGSHRPGTCTSGGR